jgi:hypothetical protein
MKYWLLFFATFLGTCWMTAQTQGNSGASQLQGPSTAQGSEAEGISVSGCLSHSNGNYTLTTKKRNTYNLLGNSMDRSDMRKDMGRVVDVQGTVSLADSAKTIQLISVKSTSKTCE